MDRIRTREDMVIALEGIYIEDADVDEAGPGAQIDVEIRAHHGSLGFTEGLTRPPGVYFLHTVNFDRDSHYLPMRGSLNFINAALARLTYTPDPDWSGSDVVSIQADDRGFSGSGGSGTDAIVIPIDTVPQNDGPLILVTAEGATGAGTTAPPPSVELWEDARVKLHNVTLYDADVNPRQLHRQILGLSSKTPYEDYPEDVNGGQFEVTVTVEHGRVFFRRTVGLTFSPAASDVEIGGESVRQGMAPFTQGARFAVAGNGNFFATENTTVGSRVQQVSWWREARFTGGLDDCNRALAAMTYWPNVNWNGVDSVHVKAVEWKDPGLGNDESAASWPQSAEASMYVRVIALNDAPVVTPPSPLWHPTLRTVDLLSPVATRGSRAFVREDKELLLPGFQIRDVDLTEGVKERALLTVTITCQHGIASMTWHGPRAGVGLGDSRHPLEENSLGADLTGLLFLDEVTGEWRSLQDGMGTGAEKITFRSSFEDANAALQTLAFRPVANFFGSGAWVRVEALDGQSSRRPSATAQGLLLSDAGIAEEVASDRGVATVPVTVLAVNDAPALHLPYSENGGDAILRLNEGEERRLDGARWWSSFATAVQASAHYPFRKGMELWKSQGIFSEKDADVWGRAREMEWKETLVADLNQGLGDGSPRHFAVWGGYLYFQVGASKRIHG